ncbi:PREDICTED: U-box domain-containing protein 33-like [Nelumbo nucifera]|uniref:RING-type E3 ubiquitin transferase n=2 Tax=Nelumbo nucifera TaxID=4432 RepID=A0A822ZZI1_NELNU|nr:PREDICTED: U-box domain-containing protein 33-like [Nelumbo nucifera]DAD47348.1 TPA_asm: hypothetical protein HUJ06_017285 [Nelumbo nucifera]
MEGGVEIEEEPPCNIDDKIFVAVGKEVRENLSVLLWTLRNSGGEKICILHVHQPAQLIPMGPMGGKFPASKVKEQEVRAYRELERAKMNGVLDEYLSTCAKEGVRAEKLVVEAEDTKKGIVDAISQHEIKKLVMGAASDKYYSKRMTQLRSKKAIFVCEQAQISCDISFVCKGILIFRRGNETGVSPPMLATGPISGINQPEYTKSLSFPQAQRDHFAVISPDNDFFRRVRSMPRRANGTRVAPLTPLPSPQVSEGIPTPRSLSGLEGIANRLEGLSGRSSSQGSEHFRGSSNGDDTICISDSTSMRDDQDDGGSMFHSADEYNMDLENGKLEKGRRNQDMYNQIKKAMEDAMAEATNAKRGAYEESTRRQEAEKSALEAKRKAHDSEMLYKKEFKKRKDMEELLAREKQEVENTRSQLDQVMKELRIAQDHKLELERKLEELHQKIASAVELMTSLKSQLDELQKERDDAVREAHELRTMRGDDGASSQSLGFLPEFPFSEIEQATQNFDPSLKTGEGGYGNVYRGLLRQTKVAIKLLHTNNSQGCREFLQEVTILSKIRHPNLITLIGACPEAWALIYEYLPNGSLEDRLARKDNTPPLSWQTRIRIAAEVCSALVFLHSHSPQRVVHGDLKPANILLDYNFVSKLSDFGICRLIPHEGSSTSPQCHRTDTKGTLAYMDPEFLDTGELTLMSDVYSFGIILLRLLTGRPAMGIARVVQYALDKGNLKAVLDESAGNWPFVQAKQLSHLALRCCERNRESRPNLSSEVWRVLDPMRASCGNLSSFRLGSGEHFQVPSYFHCPIFQEVMRDPYVAADGYTYEAEALKAWLDSGHDTSPMTNLKLAHCDLIPNHALRSAIQEWLFQP